MTARSFEEVFVPDDPAPVRRPWTEHDTRRLFGRDSPRYTDFIATAAHRSYGGGLLRVLLPGSRLDLTDFNSGRGWRREWADLEGLHAFAYDWLGRLHVVDTAGEWSAAGSVVRFSPGTGAVESATDHASSLDDYLFTLLPANAEEWLSSDYFDDWMKASGVRLEPTECVGYRVPLVLGGEDDVPNLEVFDLEVYLAISGQIFRQADKIPDGTPVDRISFER